MDNWQHEWPTKSGMYWFYGFCWGKIGNKLEEPEMHLVDVRKISNGIMCVTNGHFLYKAGGAEGVWLKAILPIPPEEVKAR